VVVDRQRGAPFRPLLHPDAPFEMATGMTWQSGAVGIHARGNSSPLHVCLRMPLYLIDIGRIPTARSFKS
jgi:hypothetical protein